MKREELKKYIYSKILAYCIRIPIADEVTEVCLTPYDVENSTVADFPYAIYERTGDYVYNTSMTKMFQFKLMAIVTNGVKEIQ